jgi:hypothetical protein
MQCATGRKLTMKNIKHATGSGGALNVEHTSYRNVRIIWVTNSSTTSWGGHVERMGGKKRNMYRASLGKSEGNIPLGRSRRRWKNYITMYHKETTWQRGLDWSGLAEGRDKWRPVVGTD